MQESSFGRLIGVLVSPAKTFEAIAARPTWVVAMVVLLVALLLAGTVIAGKIDYEDLIRNSLEEGGREIGEAQTQQAIDFGEKFVPFIISLSPPVFVSVGCLLFALILLVSLRLLGGELSYRQSFSVVVHSMMPHVLGSFLAILVVSKLDDLTVNELERGVVRSNLAFLAGEDAGAGLLSLLGSFDIFSLWSVALMVLGFTAITRVSKGTVAGTVVGLWILYILIKAGISSLTG